MKEITNMTKTEFDMLNAGTTPCPICPECGVASTEPRPNCACRIMYGQHVMRFHHVCKKENIDFLKDRKELKE